MDERTEARALGLISSALALFGVFAPYRWHDMPPVITNVALSLALLCGIWAIALVLPARAKGTKKLISSFLIASGITLTIAGIVFHLDETAPVREKQNDRPDSITRLIPLGPIPPGSQLPPGLILLFGNKGFTSTTETPHTILRMGGQKMLEIDWDATRNELVVTVLRIFDDRNNIIARIDEDGFWVENSTRNKRPNPSTLVVYDHSDTEVLRAIFMTPRTFYVTGIFRRAGSATVIIDPEFVQIGGVKISPFASMEVGGADISVQ
jgi:hypothetical protein